MAICPHCGQEIDFVQNRKITVWHRNLTPGLGCGSLIAIAIIVILFSRGHSDDIQRLTNHVKILETKIENLTTTVNRVPKQKNEP